MGTLNIEEAAFIRCCHLSEIHKDINNGKLKVLPSGKIDRDDFNDYLRKIGSSHYQPVIFDNKSGNYSVAQTSDMLNVSKEDIYNAIAKGRLTATNNGKRLILHKDDIKNWYKIFSARK